jgi:hypothetical protein
MFSLTVTFLTGAAVLMAATAPANADEYAGKQWPASAWASMDQISHETFNRLLQKHVDANGMVNYQAWHADASDRAALTSYLELLSRANSNASASREAKLAFWINAYNALTIEGILRVYPTTSIRNHTAKLVGYNIWKKLFLQVGDQQVTLDHIEHKILRPMGEPRVHFAIVCASIGCPRLLNEAYVAGRLEEQLATNTFDFFSRQQNLKTDTQGNLYLSQIISWFGGDFGNTTTAQIQALQPYFPPAAQQLVASGRYRIQYQEYDWNLNAQR